MITPIVRPHSHDGISCRFWGGICVHSVPKSVWIPCPFIFNGERDKWHVPYSAWKLIDRRLDADIPTEWSYSRSNPPHKMNVCGRNPMELSLCLGNLPSVSHIHLSTCYSGSERKGVTLKPEFDCVCSVFVYGHRDTHLNTRQQIIRHIQPTEGRFMVWTYLYW